MSRAAGAHHGPPDSVGDERWRPSAAPLAGWAVLLGALAGVQAGFGGGLLPVLVQGGAAAMIAAVAVALVVAPRIAKRRAGGLRAVPALSLASALAALSIAAMLDGASIGSWLIIGGGLGLALAVGGLARERRAERRARRAAERALGPEDRPLRRASR